MCLFKDLGVWDLDLTCHPSTLAHFSGLSLTFTMKKEKIEQNLQVITKWDHLAVLVYIEFSLSVINFSFWFIVKTNIGWLGSRKAA